MLSVACSSTACQDPTLPAAEDMSFLLIEKGPYQSLMHGGKLERLLHDKNGDGIADAIVLYGSDGRLRSAEIDTDLDGKIDRWEHFDRRGLLVGFTYDIDGDAKPDRSQLAAPQK
jgi:hypothetical protein